MERQQAIRDILLKRDIARWLQAKMLELEQGLDSAPENKVLNSYFTKGLHETTICIFFWQK